MFDYVKSIIGDRLPEWIGGSLAAIAAAAGLIIWQRGKAQWEEQTAARAAGTHFTVLVAQLEGDTDNSQTRHLVDSLEDRFSHAKDGPVIHILRYPKALNLGAAEVSDAVAKAEGKGQKWLERKNADLLVWGSASRDDKVLRLRFLAREDAAEGSASNDAKRYRLGDVLELPQNFTADVGEVLTIAVAASMRPVFDQPGHALANIVEPAVKKLTPLAANMPVDFSAETKAAIWHTYAAGEQQLGEERGDNARLETAITYFRKALGELSRQRAPLGWAMTQGNLGVALAVFAEREGTTARAEEAVVAFREALKEYTRERSPLQWAACQNNLGNTALFLGKREQGTARVEEAIAAFHEALKENTRERVPLQWAAVQSNLGIALTRVGRQENGSKRLELAVTALREALTEYNREHTPLDWAMTQNNLGVTLSIIGERENSPTRLKEAAAAYRDALTEWTRPRVPLNWAETQTNLGNTLAMLGTHESGTSALKEAIAAYELALEEIVRERVPLEWASTQNNLGLTLSTLGHRENDVVSLEKAAAAFRAALEETSRERVPMQWAEMQNNLGEALCALGEHQAEQDHAEGCATLKEARAAFLGALQEFIRASASVLEDGTRRNIGQLSRIMARLGCGG